MKKINKIFSSVLVAFIALNPMTALALEKKETVYANLDYTGEVYKTVVNNHLYVDNSEEIEDVTELEDILNINGDEKFKLNDKKLLWENTGKDIFYQGTTKKELPISVKATYYLNDKEEKVKNIIGKKGKIKIELDFSNNSYVTKNSKKIYTPIVATVGTMISDKENSNIEINNGKAIDTGSKNIVIGIASPGLYESTNLEELKDLDNITITYDTTKFSLSDIYIVATPKLLEEADFDIFDKFDKLNSSISTIQDNMNKIESGAKELENGTKTLSNGANQINNGLNDLKYGVNKLYNGSVELNNGVSELLNKISSASDQITASGVTSEYLMNKKVEINNTLTYLNSIQGQLQACASDPRTEDQLVEYLKNNLDSDNVDLVLNLINCKKTYANNAQLISVLEQSSSSLDLAIAGTYLPQVKDALTQIKGGSNQINGGLNDLKYGVDKLYNGSVELNNGAATLGNGVSTLSNGISALNNQGINKLTDYTNKFKAYGDKAQELINLSKEYNGYSSDNADSTIFIYKIKSAK